MKRLNILNLIVCAVIFFANNTFAQRGYYDAPYVRYEADLGALANATTTARSYAQSNVQSEASGQVCVNLTGAGASVSWTVSAAGDGLVVRYSVPDGQSGALDVYSGTTLLGTLNLSTNYSWEYLSTNGNSNNNGVVNNNPKMRFDEVRMKLSSKIAAGGVLKLVWKSGTISLDFAELESVPAAIAASGADVTFTGDGSTLQNFINTHGGKTIYLPAGTFNVSSQLYFGSDNTALKGAGMWYTEIHFTGNSTSAGGGLTANASNISYSGLYLSTVRNSRSDSYKAINGVYTSGSTISNIWAEHFECGAWIAQYNSGSIANADGFKMSNCRFRNNYADGTNLCKGTSNAIVEHCSYRNNGDDDMAIWSQNNQECQNNTFRYNTSENCWRSSGCAIYGGYNNQAHNLLIVDNVEVGLRVGNNFSGSPFNSGGMHVFSDITIMRCGTFNDLFNSPVGAIDILCSNIAGTQINNVQFSCIDIIDSKNDAIYMYKKAGTGFYNLVFENVTVNGTGREYPDNNVNNLNWARGYAVLFSGSPAGSGTYCNLSYTNRGGNATAYVNTAQIGSFSWTKLTSCVAACASSSGTTITSAATFGICDNPKTISATTTATTGNTVSSIEFFVDNVSIGSDNSSPYSIAWNNATVGSHQVKAVSTYSDATNSTSSIQNVTVVNGMYQTTAAPVIDGTIDGIWSEYPAMSLNKVSVGIVSSPADLSASFKVMRDATNLYILADVTDDILSNSGTNNWEKDAVEIYIDMGNDKGTTYVANSDFQYTFVWGISTAQAGVTFAQTTKPGNLGYVMEIMIPWTTLHNTPQAGDFTGFEMEVEDSDSKTRDGKKAWTDSTDNAWQNPSVLGTLQVAGCASPLACTAVNIPGTIQAEAYCQMSGVQIESSTDGTAAQDVGYIDAGDWMSYKINVPSTGLYLVQYRLASNAAPGMSLQLESLGGATIYDNVNIPNTGGWQTWTTVSHTVNLPAGIQYLAIATSTGGFNVNWLAVAIPTGISEVASSLFSMYPNPVSDLLTVNSPVEIREFAIYDAMGRMVYTVSNPGNNFNVNFASFSAGYYTVVITNNSGQKQRGILVK